MANHRYFAGQIFASPPRLSICSRIGGRFSAAIKRPGKLPGLYIVSLEPQSWTLGRLFLDD
jgi:hypothetical protein